MNDDLDWNRLRSGDNRAMDPDHQDVFDLVAEQRAEIERLRGLLRQWRQAADLAEDMTFAPVAKATDEALGK